MKELFDPIRKRLVAATPEEFVRQSAIQFLIQNCHVPQNLLEVEFSLSALSKTTKDRVDLIVHNYNQPSHPWLLAECKAPEKYSWENLEAQVNRYLQILTPSYLWLVLGNENKIFACTNNGYTPIAALPLFPKL